MHLGCHIPIYIIYIYYIYTYIYIHICILYICIIYLILLANAEAAGLHVSSSRQRHAGPLAARKPDAKGADRHLIATRQDLQVRGQPRGVDAAVISSVKLLRP